MSDDPFKEASKYNTAVRNVDRWVARRTAAIKEEATRKYHELRQALSPAAARIVVAAEMQEHVPPEVFHTAPSSGFVGKGIVEQLDAEGLVSPDPEWQLVHRIVLDICNRKGLDDMWHDIDVEIRNEITNKWEGFCRDELRVAVIHAQVAEREACARLCMSLRGKSQQAGWLEACDSIMVALRSRTTEGQSDG